jgi:flagellin-like hook-associated protein FlgL
VAIIPIPSTRTSDLLTSQRLLSQLQSDQRSLLEIQSQLSTGRRIFTPSDDAPAAQRAIVLQRLLEQKAQVEANRSSSQSYLAASETTLAEIGTLISDIRAEIVGVSGSIVSDEQRGAAIAQVQRAIEQLTSIGNQRFRGRYLFGGASTGQPPFSAAGKNVIYHGNERHLQTFADVDLLVNSNLHGNEVFGAISAEVRSSVDFNPILTLDTRLADLRGGHGVAQGSFTISDGNSSRTIDISGAETVGDIVQLIERNPPVGRAITARITSYGLQIEIDAAGGGSLSISEVGGGTTASSLGILTPLGSGTGPIVGSDLDPRLRGTTRLENILGVRASAMVASGGTNNDLVIEYNERGAAGNGIAMQFVDDARLQAAPGLTAGSETANFATAATAARASLRLAGNDNDLLLTANQPGTAFNNVRIDVTTAAIGNAANVSFAGGVLSIQIDSGGATTVDTLQNAIALEGTFTATYDTSVEAGVNGAATIAAASAGIDVGNTGNSGGEANTLFVHVDAGDTTANQVIAAIENAPAVAALFRVRLDGKDTTMPSLAGEGVIQISATATTTGGIGLEFDENSGIQITNGDETHTITFAGAETVEDLLNVLNGSSANVLAEINSDGKGIDVRSRLSGADFSIGENGGATATQLGLRTFTSETPLASLNYGRGIFPAEIGPDFTIRRRDGVELAIDVSGTTTVQDVLDLINNHPDNLDPATQVIARLAPFGNGIELVDNNSLGTQTLQVTQSIASLAAEGLGLVSKGQSQAVGTASGMLQGRDVNPLETQGIFNTLTRLLSALENNDLAQVERGLEMLDVDFNRITFARSEIGARQQSLEVLGRRLEDEGIELQRALSEEIDVDMVEAISNFTQRQAAFQAALQTTAATFRLTLLDFL